VSGHVLLLGGPAGAGTSTLAGAWCQTRERAVHLELDAVRSQIVSGLADPQLPGALADEQYDVSVEATCAQARVFAEHGYDVAIDDVFEPDAFERHWRPRLAGLAWQLVIVLPSLEETLQRSRSRTKRVLEAHTREQHARCGGWDGVAVIDTTGLTVEESVDLLLSAIR
jgi:chloramphenicol 3-O-phosphotransferase